MLLFDSVYPCLFYICFLCFCDYICHAFCLFVVWTIIWNLFTLFSCCPSWPGLPSWGYTLSLRPSWLVTDLACWSLANNFSSHFLFHWQTKLWLVLKMQLILHKMFTCHSITASVRVLKVTDTKQGIRLIQVSENFMKFAWITPNNKKPVITRILKDIQVLYVAPFVSWAMVTITAK